MGQGNWGSEWDKELKKVNLLLYLLHSANILSHILSVCLFRSLFLSVSLAPVPWHIFPALNKVILLPQKTAMSAGFPSRDGARSLLP